MSLTQPLENNALYLYIIAGTLMQKVTSDTKGAVLRLYETSDGAKGEKWELHHSNLTGYISGIEFRDSDFGEQCNIKISDGKDTAVLNIGTDSRYFIDFAQKLSNIDFNAPVTINPYDFENKENHKQIKGMSIVQLGQKVENFFYDKEKKCNINGLPEPDGNKKEYDKDDWKVYFIKLKKFLKGHVQKQISSVGKFEVDTKDEKPINKTEFKASEVDNLPEEIEGDPLPF